MYGLPRRRLSRGGRKLGTHSFCDKGMEALLEDDLPFEVDIGREEVPRGDGGGRGGASTSNCSGPRRHDLVWILFL